MEWKNATDQERKYPLEIIEQIMEAFFKTSNGLAELTLNEIKKPLFRIHYGLNTFFQYSLDLRSKYVEGYYYELFKFGFDADFEKIGVIVCEDIFKEVIDLSYSPNKVVIVKNKEFLLFLEDVFNSKKFSGTVKGLMQIAERNRT